MEEVSFSGTEIQMEDFLKNRMDKEFTKFLLEYQYPNNISLEIDWNLLDHYEPQIADEIIEKPYLYIESIKRVVLNNWLEEGTKPSSEYIIPRIFNLPDSTQVRHINASMKDKLISVEGLLTRTAEAKLQIITGVFECRKCGRLQKLLQTDREEIKYPPACPCGVAGKNAFSFSEADSTFKDSQKIEIQEPIEILSGGEEAQKIVMWSDYDLVNRFKVGQRVIATGIVHGDFKKKSLVEKYLEVVHIQKLDKEFSELDITPQEKEQIVALSKDPNINTKIRNSISPDIWGHDVVKDTLSLVLFGGAYTKANRQFRSDIHILLIGDPGLGKSKLAQQAIELSPIHIYVSGKSASGAGLTVSMIKDDFGDGGYTIKAGATVLGCGGVVAIDEFDKINDIDKASLHEVMESQSVSLAKGGVVATFKANPAIVAIANPKGTRFDPYQPIGEQFEIPPSLLSRFDVILPFREGTIQEEREMALVDFIYDKREKAKTEGGGGKPEIDRELLRKYIAYARRNIIPEASKEAKELITRYYIDLRKLAEKQKAIPATPRQLEALIRLSEASAKMRLSNMVEKVDADRAIEIMRFFLREIGTDSETGEVDIGIMYTGTTTSKIERTKMVLKLIREADNHMIEEPELIRQAQQFNINDRQVMEIIEILRRNVDISVPKPKLYRSVE